MHSPFAERITALPAAFADAAFPLPDEVEAVCAIVREVLAEVYETPKHGVPLQAISLMHAIDVLGHYRVLGNSQSLTDPDASSYAIADLTLMLPRLFVRLVA